MTFRAGLTWCVSVVLALCTAANCMLRRECLPFACEKLPTPAPSPPAIPNTHLFICPFGSEGLHHKIAPELHSIKKKKSIVKFFPRRQKTPAYYLRLGHSFLSSKSQKGDKQATGAPEILSPLAVWKKSEESKPEQREDAFELGVSAPSLSKQAPSPLQRVV